jgi:hypothetical protein
MHLDLETDVRDLFIAKLREFEAFCRENWQMTEQDMRDIIRPIAATTLQDAYIEGYNAAMTDGLTGALDLWTDEMGYT